MAFYPTLPWMQAGTVIEREGGITPVRATNGLLKVRRLYTAEKRRWKAEHWLSDSQRTTLEAFYVANRVLNVDLVSPDDSQTYSVRFAAAPVYQWTPGYWIARVSLEEV